MTYPSPTGGRRANRGTLAGCALLALGLVAACSAPSRTTGPQAVPSLEALAETADSLASAPSPAIRRALAERALSRAGVTPFADFGRHESANPRYVVDADARLGDAPLVGGLLPGRYPLSRPDLVIVGTDVDSPAAASVLEAMRVLVERSQWHVVPERTVMVALWTGDRGVSQALASGVWPRANVRALLVVGAPLAAAPDGVETVTLPATATASGSVDLAQSILDQAIRLAQRPRFPAPLDTLAVR